MSSESDIVELPAYSRPAFYSVDGSWKCGEKTTHTITVQPDPTRPEREIEFVVNDEEYELLIVSIEERVGSKGLWTIVHYLRDYGVPGVWKERIRFNDIEWRLGALYCIGPFDLTERETNYNKYGESKL